MRVVQLFGREATEAARFDDLNRGHLDANLDSITYYALYFPAIEVLTSIALASLIVAGAHRVEVGSLTVGTVAAFLQLVRRFFQPLQDLSDKFNTLQQAMAASERVFRLLDTPAADLGGPAVGANLARLPARAHGAGVTIEFEDVWFAYDIGHVARESGPPVSPEWVLKGVSFKVEPGKTLALVGHTGAGKTTIINLLLRFYDPQRGRILVDGVDVRELPAFRAAVADRLRAAGHFPLRRRRAYEHPIVESYRRGGGRDRRVARWSGPSHSPPAERLFADARRAWRVDQRR